MRKYISGLVTKKKKKSNEEDDKPAVDFKTYNPEINKGVFTKKPENEIIHSLSNDVMKFFTINVFNQLEN